MTILVNELNSALRKANLPHVATYVASDDPMVEDDEIELRLAGQPTRFAVQITQGYAGINEYGFENGELAWMRDIKLIPLTKPRAICAAVVSLLKDAA